MYYSIDLYRNKDFTWGATMMGLWVPVEICCGFLAACMPVFPRFFNQQPFSRLGSSLRSLFRLHSSPSDRYSRELTSKSDTAGKQRAQQIVTDIEFEELVKRTDLSMASIEQPESRRYDAGF
jgi:hypothetical protein